MNVERPGTATPQQRRMWAMEMIACQGNALNMVLDQCPNIATWYRIATREINGVAGQKAFVCDQCKTLGDEYGYWVPKSFGFWHPIGEGL